MQLRQKQTLAPKSKLNQTLRNWLPILQATPEELKQTLEPFLEDNPFACIEQNKKTKINYNQVLSKNSNSDKLEVLSIDKPSLYQRLLEQITPPTFPTKKSQEIAIKIIECINAEGYFEPDDEYFLPYTKEEVEKIRARFVYLEPVGVGALDIKEALLFQLQSSDVEDEIYQTAKQIIDQMHNIAQLTKLPYYQKAISIIKHFHTPPAIEYIEESNQVIVDIFIDIKDGEVSVRVNDEMYPQILLDTIGIDETNQFVAAKIKQAKDIIDALQMRKATLYKIGLMIVEYQYDYFCGGDIKPMTLKDIADELGRNPSTISRAISNKYLECPRGTIALKQFFTTNIASSENSENGLSNATIKTFLQNLIKQEPKNKPLSDLKIQELIFKEFGINIVRRTITKYRKALNIGSSSERKRLYLLQG